MKNAEYDSIFLELFTLEKKQLGPHLVYQSIDSWDSVGHMELMAKIENKFGINLEMDDVIDFTSYDEGKRILSKYGVPFRHSD